MLDATGAKILDRERDWRRKVIKEAIWERLEDPTMNRKGGLGPLCLTLGTGPSSPFLEVCHMIVNYHVTSFANED